MDRSVIVRVAMLAGVSAAVVIVASSLAQAETRAQFCARWHGVCARCDGLGATVSRQTCLKTCGTRLAECRTSGCYFFNVPGPRCQGQ
jgi:hypothetical protein